jgi:hypothetical protein
MKSSNKKTKTARKPKSIGKKQTPKKKSKSAYLKDPSELNAETLEKSGEMKSGSMPLFSQLISIPPGLFKKN